MFFIVVVFFGMGNIVSINSFDFVFVYCFLIVFLLFVMGSLLFCKVFIFFVIVVCMFDVIYVVLFILV